MSDSILDRIESAAMTLQEARQEYTDAVDADEPCVELWQRLLEVQAAYIDVVRNETAILALCEVARAAKAMREVATMDYSSRLDRIVADFDAALTRLEANK